MIADYTQMVADLEDLSARICVRFAKICVKNTFYFLIIKSTPALSWILRRRVS